MVKLDKMILNEKLYEVDRIEGSSQEERNKEELQESVFQSCTNEVFYEKEPKDLVTIEEYIFFY